jgi:hypothetical protein
LVQKTHLAIHPLSQTYDNAGEGSINCRNCIQEWAVGKKTDAKKLAIAAAEVQTLWMPRTRITLTGADPLGYRDTLALSSRLLRFPDGVTRLITLTGWQWTVFDQWPGRTGCFAFRLLEQALTIAATLQAENGDARFEENVHSALTELVNGFKIVCCSPEDLTAGNDNTYQLT